MTRVLIRLSRKVNATLLFLKIFGSLFGWPSLSASINSSMSSWLIMVKLCNIQPHTMIETIFLGLCTVISLSRLKRPFRSPNDLSTTCRADEITWLNLFCLWDRWPLSLKGGIKYVLTGYALSAIMNLLAPKSSPFSAISEHPCITCTTRPSCVYISEQHFVVYYSLKWDKIFDVVNCFKATQLYNLNLQNRSVFILCINSLERWAKIEYSRE